MNDSKKLGKLELFGSTVNTMVEMDTNKDVSYDAPFKRIFSDKAVLASLIGTTVDIFKGQSQQTIMECIDNIQGDTIVDPGFSKVMSNELSLNGEATIKYDILTTLHKPGNKDCLVDVLVRLDVEMQRKGNPGYPLTKRGIYYCSRMISDQLESLVDAKNYNKLVPVYSIWIVMNSQMDIRGNVVNYKIKNVSDSKTLEKLKNSRTLKMLDNGADLMDLTMIFLDRNKINNYTVGDDEEGVIEYLNLLFSKNIFSIRMKNYGSFDARVVKEVDTMTNFLQEIAEEREEGRAEGRKELVMQRFKKMKALGYTDKEIIKDLVVLGDMDVNEVVHLLNHK